MKNTKHTSEEWRIAPNKLVICKGNTNEVIADCDTTDESGSIKRDEMEANAKLIASAPELLESLIKLQKNLEQLILRVPTGTIRNLLCEENIEALLAIEKATK